MRDREDQELRGLFRDLKKKDGERVPDFGTLMARAREEASRSGLEVHTGGGGTRHILEMDVFHFTRRRAAWGGSLLAAAAAAVLLLVQGPGTTDSQFVQAVQAYSSDPALGAWTSPTDALLELPGGEILSTVPSIGTSRLLANPGLSPRRNEL